MESVSLYSEARNEYLKQMATWIVPPLVEFFRKEYAGIAQREGRRAMTVFQTWCADVPRWNQDVIDGNVNALLDSCRCDYVEELMTAVFIAHTKMLTAIRVNTRQKKLQITLPKLDHFLHRVFVECARAFWKAPFLFIDSVSHIDMQKNVLQAEAMCTEALSGAVRSLLPVKSILRDNLEDEGSSSSEEDEPVPKSKHVRHKFKKSAGGGTPAPPPAVVADEEVDDIDDDTESEGEDVGIEEPLFEEPTVPVATPVVAPEPVAPVPEPVVVPEPVALVPEPVVVTEPVVAPVTTPVPEPEPRVETEKSLTANVTNKQVTLIKDEPVREPEQEVKQEFVIDTEPSVHFTPYDTVYDETTPNISEIRYAPKQSIEDMPPSTWGEEDEYLPLPRIEIQDAVASLSDFDVEDLNAPLQPPKGYEEEEEDSPMDLTGADFEEL